MINKILTILTILALLLPSISIASSKKIALTIDDLPFVGDARNHPRKLEREYRRLNRMIDILISKKVPVTGFVVARSIEKGQWALLQKFHNAGFIIANHTYSHLNLNATSANHYISNIERADKTLAPLMPGQKYFRYPYLAEGRGERKQQVINYLSSKGYIIAPVTIDSKDFRFNQRLFAVRYSQRKYYLPRIKRSYLNFLWRQTVRADRRANKRSDKPIKHILLLHANLLNSHLIGEIIDFYRAKGYTFISLDEALKNYNQSMGRQEQLTNYDEISH